MAGSKQKRNARAAILEEATRGQDRPRCRYCGVPVSRKAHRLDAGDALPFTLDHIIPLAAGGTWERRNLAPCCRLCNELKGDRPLVALIAQLMLHGMAAMTLEEAQELMEQAAGGVGRDAAANTWARKMKAGWRH